jgi:small GTP-binding protein
MAVAKPSSPDTTPAIKLVLLGSSAVGKTSIISILNDKQFVPDRPATVGPCFHIKKMKVGNTTIKFHIWDTAGDERYRAVAPMYYRGAQFVLLVYAIDNHESFNQIRVWYNSLVDDCSPMPHIVLVANKNDIAQQRQVEMDEGRALARELAAMFFEVSAKADAQGIRRMLDEIAIEAVKYFGQDQIILEKKGLILNQGPERRCC